MALNTYITPDVLERSRVITLDNAEDSHKHSDLTITNIDASKITTGTISIERLPAGALERLIQVNNQASRFALTESDVQLGDTVQELDTGLMFRVINVASLSSAAGYVEYTAGKATSVPWSGVTDKPALIDAVNSTSTTQAPTANAVKTAYDKAKTAQDGVDAINALAANSSYKWSFTTTTGTTVYSPDSSLPKFRATTYGIYVVHYGANILADSDYTIDASGNKITLGFSPTTSDTNLTVVFIRS